ncbi:MAG: SpaA isopeptide-forming pilin-related protein, partial [Coriobacteriaceae bacterium]|nr:SpaA isopeptide-forming pilin-related protein [Coriobacteriaceae bacterium]
KDSGNNNWGAQAKAIEESAGGQYRYLFDYLDLNGQVVPADKVTVTNGGRNAKIGADQLEIPYNGSILTAHFKQNPNYVGASRVDSLKAWMDEIKGTNVPLDEAATKKTAEVYDYENRIYRVDLTTRSSLNSFTGTVDLGLILDVSGSMMFPSKLVKAKNAAGAEIGTKSIRTINNATAWDWRGNPIRYAWQDWGLSTSEEYYVIAEHTTKATVFRLFYNQSDNAWYRVDASCDNSHGSRRKIDASTVFGADNTDAATTYLVYASADNNANGTPVTRSYYEKQSIDNTAATLNQVLQILNVAQDSAESPIVRAAWNTFAAKVKTTHPAFVSLQDHSTLGIDYATLGGTRTDKALTDALGFEWGDSNTKYAILITDGAPQFGSQSSSSDGYDPDPYNSNSYTLEQQTAELVRRIKVIKQEYEERGIKLITVGLSMKDVEMGTQLLYDIADTVNGKRMFFEAESGDELENILLEIVKNFILPCNVYGDVTDTVGEAFYLVDRTTGKPLKAGDHISLSGDVTDDLSGAYGTVQADGTTVKWENQEFTPEGWHGSVYVKAKEDLLGGNMLPTNTGNAVIEAKQYSTRTNPDHKITLTTNTEQLVNPEKFHPVQQRETPLVNVNELSFLHDQTEWTVYLGTEVDPKDQLRRLYDDILVEEVIKNGKGQDTNGDGLPDMACYDNGDTDNNWYPISADDITDNRESQASIASARNTFTMNDLLVKLIKELAANGDASRGDWASFITADGQGNDVLNWDYFLTEAMKGDGIVIPYREYGIADGSNITITLAKEIVAGEEADLVNASPHATTVLSGVDAGGAYDPVEKYTLTVLYSPDYTVLPRGQGGSNTQDYHAGVYGTMYQGHAAGTETSTNIHSIYVYAKGLSVTKTTEDFNKLLPGAEFTLYRTARGTDAAEAKVEVEGLTGQYVAVATLDLGAEATKAIDTLERLDEGEKYYLVETKVPAGYVK